MLKKNHWHGCYYDNRIDLRNRGGGVLPLLIQQKKLTETFSSICSIIG